MRVAAKGGPGRALVATDFGSDMTEIAKSVGQNSPQIDTFMILIKFNARPRGNGDLAPEKSDTSRHICGNMETPMTGISPSLRALTTMACLLAATIFIAIGGSPAEGQRHGRHMRGPMSQSPTDFWSPDWMNRGMWRGGRGANSDVRARMRRHWTFMHYGIPAKYRDAKSPLKPTDADVKAGGALYADNCAKCHGDEGLGNGEAAKGLTPSPALLAYLIQRPRHSGDEYLLWTIAEGGQQFETDMPAFKETLSQDEIWRIVAYMRGGFPKAATEGTN